LGSIDQRPERIKTTYDDIHCESGCSRRRQALDLDLVRVGSQLAVNVDK
jgi:hypothetical protein